MSMITKEELSNFLSEQGMICFEVARPSIDAITVLLKSDGLDELVRFAKVNNIKSIFYNYIYYNKEMFYITEEQTKKIEKEVYSIIKSEIKEFNTRISSFNYSRPFGINIFCLYEGQAICTRSHDLWHEEYGLLLGEQKLRQLIEDNKKIIEEAQQNKQKEDEALLKELREYISKDPEFKLNTFPGARRDYIRAIFRQRKETQKYRHLLFSEDDINYASMQKAVDFIEILWRDKNQIS